VEYPKRLPLIVRKLTSLLPEKTGKKIPPAQSGPEESPSSFAPSLSTEQARRFPVRRVLLLSSVAGAVFIIGLLNGFPHKEIARFFLRELSDSGGVGLHARNARFDLPASLGYSDLSLVTPSPYGPLNWTIDRASAHLELASLASRKPRFNFQVKAYGGEFEGLLRHLSKTRNHLRGATVLPVDLEKTRPLLHQDISGSMNFNTDYTWQTGKETAGHGIVSTTIGHLVLKSLNISGFPLPPVSFDKVRSRVFLSGGRGRVEKLRATGPLADIDGSGTFLLVQPYPNTILHLKLLVHLKGALGSLPLPNLSGTGGPDKVVTLTLEGPVSNLNIAMNGIPIPH
jgi:type II secretion system protein N